MTDGEAVRRERAHVAVGGRSCAAVASGLCLGLWGSTIDGAVEAAERAATVVFERVARSRGHAFLWYDVPYGVALVRELVRATRARGLASDAAHRADAVCSELIAEHGARARVSPLDAALLWWASRHDAPPAASASVWIEVLLRSQRQDGSWPACPLYTLPTRGNLINWYATRLTTSSYAYRTLANWKTTRE
jgi:hypothetical protein